MNFIKKIGDFLRQNWHIVTVPLLIALGSGGHLIWGIPLLRENGLTILLGIVFLVSILIILWSYETWREQLPQNQNPTQPPQNPPPQNPPPAAPEQELRRLKMIERRGKILTVIWFLVMTLILLLLLNSHLQKSIPSGKVTAAWKPEGEVELLPGPANFTYDSNSPGSELQYSGLVDDAVKRSLLSLFPQYQPGDLTADEKRYQEAIGRLAIKSQSSEESTEPFEPKAKNYRFQAGPAKFFYDPLKKQLTYRGTIDDVTKRQLLTLFEEHSSQAALLHLKSERSYHEAIGRLGLRSAEQIDISVVSLLMISGLGGALGSVIRLIFNFIGNACYKRDLDQEVWWPTYFLNPLLGFLLGIVVLVLVKAGWMSVESNSPKVEIWWLGLAVLVGFGTADVMERLRLITKAAFGSDGSNKRPPDDSNPDSANPVNPPLQPGPANPVVHPGDPPANPANPVVLPAEPVIIPVNPPAPTPADPGNPQNPAGDVNNPNPGGA